MYKLYGPLMARIKYGRSAVPGILLAKWRSSNPHRVLRLCTLKAKSACLPSMTKHLKEFCANGQMSLLLYYAVFHAGSEKWWCKPYRTKGRISVGVHTLTLEFSSRFLLHLVMKSV